MPGLFKKITGKSGKKSPAAAQHRSAEQGDSFAGTGIKELTLINNEIVIQQHDGAQLPLLHKGKIAIEISDEARCQIARKIARLLPELGDTKKLELLDYTERVLKSLCKDQLVRVRRILAQELKDYPDAPHELITTLAWDESLEVAGPVLECSPVLTDQDLVQIIQGAKIPGVSEAVAKRSRLSSFVADAIVRTGHRAAITRLLRNEEADISEGSYERIVEEAPEVEMWHEPLMLRPDLPGVIMNKLAGFVSESLVIRLREEGKLSKRSAKELLHGIQERLDDPSLDKRKNAAENVEDLFTEGRLDAETIDDAICRKDLPFVCSAIGLLAKCSDNRVRKVIDSHNPKAITALCWKAGLPMRISRQIQLRLARIHHTRLLNPKNGTDYPLSPEEMKVYLDLVGD